MSDAVRHYTNEFRSRRDVSPYDAEVLFDALIAENDIEMLVELLTAWTTKGITEDELYRFALIMRSRMKTVATDLSCVDIVGTGGSRAKTFNVSTAAAFVVAGAGVPVAKHGNRAATSASGSADVLSHLGVEFDVQPKRAEENLAKHGITFMFAPRHHSLSKTLAAARKNVAFPTIFNAIGPLSNPADAQHRLIGVWDERLLNSMSRVLLRLGTKRSWIVNSVGTLDEIGLAGTTKVIQIDGDRIEGRVLTPEDFGIEGGDPVPSINDAAESAKLIGSILKNKSTDSAAESIVLINAAAAIWLTGAAKTLSAALSTARESIRSGAALDKLEALRQGAK
jgi:anthranilate phosphoribosyltransferase